MGVRGGGGGIQWWRDLNFSMGFNIIAPYMEFLHLNWYIAERIHFQTENWGGGIKFETKV